MGRRHEDGSRNDRHRGARRWLDLSGGHARPAGGVNGKRQPALVLSLLDEASKAIGEALKQRDEIIKKLESRSLNSEVAALSIRRRLSQGEIYYMGNFATDGGSIWHANEATMDTPAKARAGPWHAEHGAAGRDGGRDRR